MKGAGGSGLPRPPFFVWEVSTRQPFLAAMLHDCGETGPFGPSSAEFSLRLGLKTLGQLATFRDIMPALVGRHGGADRLTFLFGPFRLISVHYVGGIEIKLRFPGEARGCL